MGRRNLTDEQKSYLRGRQYDAEKMSQGGTGANQYINAQTGQNVQSAPKTRREQQDGTAGRIGRETGVDGRTVRRDSEFANGLDAAESASPGIREAILSGEVKAHRTQRRRPQREQIPPRPQTRQKRSQRANRGSGISPPHRVKRPEGGYIKFRMPLPEISRTPSPVISGVWTGLNFQLSANGSEVAIPKMDSLLSPANGGSSKSIQIWADCYWTKMSESQRAQN